MKCGSSARGLGGAGPVPGAARAGLLVARYDEGQAGKSLGEAPAAAGRAGVPRLKTELGP